MFTHLHLHTEYSLLDGAAKIKDVVKYAKELGMTSLAITDHGVMYGVVDFYTEAKENGIKPIVGCEVYTSAKSRFDKDKNEKYYHLVLLAKNETGYRNLMKISSIGFTEGYYYKPRVDIEILSKYSEGLICLSACLRGEVNTYLLENNYEKAKETALKYKCIFGDDYYLEIQNHNIKEEIEIIDKVIKLSKEINVKVVATNDVHYTKKEDAMLQDVLLCVQTAKKIHEEDRMKFQTEEFYLKTEEEMLNIFSSYPDAIYNTEEVANKCNLEIDFSKIYLPKYDEKIDADKYLENLCREGLDKHNLSGENVEKRLLYELETISKMGYSDYFLIVWDYVNFAKENSISVGPGRGSAAGSLVAYLLGITDVNPLEYNLIFERFLNPERVTMPDIDIDFCYVRRGEVIDYITKKYGKERVAQIVAFDTMKARAAVRDVGRVFDISYKKTDLVAKLIPRDIGMTLSFALDNVNELKNLYNTDFEVKKLIDMALKIEGMPRNITTHAAGLVIGDKSLNNYVPVLTSDSIVLTQYPMNILEKLGLVKMDLLALRNLTIISDAQKLIKTEDEKFSLDNIDYNDQKVYKLISDADTDGVFQLESDGMKSFLKDLKPNCFEDLIAGLSLYRPATAKIQIPLFIKNRKNNAKITYKHPLLEDILKPTYGSIVYQEQAMEIFKTLAGYSLGRADKVRRAMAKKKHEELKKEKEIFINGLKDEHGNVIIKGCLANNISKECALSIFDELNEFSKYAFNKSHATSYAKVAYQTAYLKVYYPKMYLAALLENTLGSGEKFEKYIDDFSKYNIKLLKPDINKSFDVFTPEGDNIRFAFSQIKGVGEDFGKSICEIRKKHGNFTSFDDFLNNLPLQSNKRCIEALIKCGAFDEISPNRRALMIECETGIDDTIKHRREMAGGQISLFGEIEKPKNKYEVSDFKLSEKMEFEKEYTGVYFSGNPLDEYAAKIKAFSNTDILNLKQTLPKEGTKVFICGNVKSLSVKKIASGKIASLILEDYTSDIELVLFNGVIERYETVLKPYLKICVEGKVSYDYNDKINVTVLKVYLLDNLTIDSAKKLYLKIDDTNDFQKVKDIIKDYKGTTSICIYFAENGNIITTDDKNNIEICNEIILKLENLLGRDNVKIK
ncbi:MAG: DNA polymerase III subunit alpha [Ruminococcaceae bacterium]|nr:DNA polymerase III subunit alpha [Oscillospiraceae bacterium]